MGNPNTSLAEAVIPGSAKQTEAKHQDPVPGTMNCLQMPIRHPQAPGWLSHAGVCCPSTLCQGGLRFISQPLFYAPKAPQGSCLTTIHQLLPVTVSSHPTRNLAMTQLTKLAAKQPQLLQAGGWQKVPDPAGERAPTALPAALHACLPAAAANSAGAGSGARSCTVAGLGPAGLRPLWAGAAQTPPVLDTVPCPRSEASRARERPRARMAGCELRPYFHPLGWLPPALRSESGRGLCNGAEAPRPAITASLALWAASPCLR